MVMAAAAIEIERCERQRVGLVRAPYRSQVRDCIALDLAMIDQYDELLRQPDAPTASRLVSSRGA